MVKHTETSAFGVGERSNHDSTKFYTSELYRECLVKNASLVDNIFPVELQNTLICNSAEKMQELPDSCVHLMITSPPYNVSKEYDKDLSLSDYTEFLKQVFLETYRVLVNGGRACINVANVGRKPYVPLSDYISKLMRDIGFNQRGEIIWDKGASVGGSCAWGSWRSASNPTLRDVHEYILVFCKGDFKRIKKTGNNTLTSQEFTEYTKSIWKMNTASAKKIGHPAPFPVELPKRLINLYSFEGDVVLDPFIGSGTTALAALELNRKYIGYEIDLKYIEIAQKRIKQQIDLMII